MTEQEPSVLDDGVVEAEAVQRIVPALQVGQSFETPGFVAVDGRQRLEPRRIVDIVGGWHIGLAPVPQLSDVVGPLLRRRGQVRSRGDLDLEGSGACLS